MPQSYEPCFSFSVPPGKPLDPAYSDPGPILSSREAGWTRHITTAASSTTSESPSTASPFAFSVPSEPCTSQRNSFVVNNSSTLLGPGSSQPSIELSHRNNLNESPGNNLKVVEIWPRSCGDGSSAVVPISTHFPYSYPTFHQPIVSPKTTDDQRPHQSFCLQPAPLRKRPRRRFEEIERLYSCKYHGCTKAYGTLNHLNAHVLMQKHGPKRLPEEFKEIRKEWRMKNKSRENNDNNKNIISSSSSSVSDGQTQSQLMNRSSVKKSRTKVGDQHVTSWSSSIQV